MAPRLIIIATLIGVVAMAPNASASGTSYDTPEEAALAGLESVLGEGTTILGDCADFPTEPGSWDVCYRGGSVDGESYWRYSAEPLGISDMQSWLGVKPVEGGWVPYDGGPCRLGYCRQTDPSGAVLMGWPDGDADRDGVTNSLDALVVLQLVAHSSETLFLFNGDVDGASGLTSLDALLILQHDAGLLDGLPVRRGEPPFGDK